MLWHSLDDVPADWRPCVVTIGVFDGVHRGHARLIGRTVEVAREQRLPAVLVTFDPHPARVAGPPRDTAALSTPRRRAELAGRLGVDAVLVLPFTGALAGTPAREFVTRVLVDALRAKAVVVGHDFRFGARAAGDLATLRDLGLEFGFTAEGVGLLGHYSSTHVRTCLARGDVHAAAEALGRPHRVAGRLAGDVLEIPTGTALPADGRYRGLLAIDAAAPHPVDVTVNGERVCVRPQPIAGTYAAELDFVGADYPTSPACSTDGMPTASQNRLMRSWSMSNVRRDRHVPSTISSR